MQKFLLSIVCCFTVVTTYSQTFSVNLNDTIPDAGPTVYFDLNVTGLPNVIDTSFGLESVCLTMLHTYDGDMDVKLVAPDGTTVTLFSGIGGGDDDFTNTCLGDKTLPAINAAGAPFTGLFSPMGNLGNANNGQNPNGLWQLACRDMAGQDLGVLLNWSITFGSNPALPFMFASSNLPICKITTQGSAIPNDPKVLARLEIIDNGTGLRNFSNQTNYKYEGDILVELQGFSGPGYPKKNYDFDLIDTAGLKIDTSLLGMPAENDWIFKAEYLDHTLMKNAVTYEMARRMGRYAPRTKYCELILDGEYIGVYTLTEKVKRSVERVDIANLKNTDTAGTELTGGYIIEMNINGDPADWNSAYLPANSATCGLNVEFKHVYPKTADILPVQHDYIKNYTDSFENALMDTNYLDPVNGYRKYVDVSTFIDFLIVNEFSVNYDSYGRSTYLYKEKITDGGKLKIGPPWDYDRAMDYDNFGTSEGWVWEITHPYWPFPFWWGKMNQDSVYRKELACRWFTLREATLSTDSFMVMIDTLHSLLDESQQRNFEVWNDLGGQTYPQQVENLKNYLTTRLNWMDSVLGLENVQMPLIALPNDTAVCAGEMIDAFTTAEYNYNWVPGPDTSVFTPSQSGIYTMKVNDAYGCKSAKAVDVTVNPLPDATFTAQVQSSNGLGWVFVPATINAQTYLWDFGDASGTSSTIAPLHGFADSGSYIITLSIVDSLGCSSSASNTISVQLISGINDIADVGASVYPNPFNSNVNISFNEVLNESVNITIVNAIGDIVYSKRLDKGVQNYTVSTDNLASGIYLLQLSTAAHRQEIKLIKQ
jgi:subtilisin-like proprotein convertase family protein